MAKLNQIIAVESGEKTRATNAITALYHQLQKAAGFQGLARQYTPIEDGGETLPSESTKVQLRAADLLAEMVKSQVSYFDVTASKDVTNCTAAADVVVDGVVILPSLPVSYLLFLEKKLVDWQTFLSKLPILDAAEDWNWSAGQDCWSSNTVETTRTKKIPRNHVKAEATDKHPAQVEIYHEDVRVGTWKTIKYSGAMPASEVRVLTEKVEKLITAVKFAREQANNTEAVSIKVGEALSGYLVGK